MRNTEQYRHRTETTSTGLVCEDDATLKSRSPSGHWTDKSLPSPIHRRRRRAAFLYVYFLCFVFSGLNASSVLWLLFCVVGLMMSWDTVNPWATAPSPSPASARPSASVKPRRDRTIANWTKCHKLPKFFLFVSLSPSSGDMPSACTSSPVMVWWTQFCDRGNHYVIKQDGDFVWWGDTCLWQRDLIYYLLERCLTRYNEYRH